MATILDGKTLAKTLGEKLKEEVSHLERKPKLVIIQIGSLPASNTYIKRKIAFGAEVGIEVEHKQFADSVTEQDIVQTIEGCNADASVDGIIVQLPLPEHMSKDILESIDPKKDVDGLTSRNLKLLFDKKSGLVSATTRGILALLDHYNVEIDGKKITIVGRSTLVGRPTAFALLNRNATVTMCHSHTRHLADETKPADILIVAVGKAGLITKDFVRSGQVVIDVGINVLDAEKKIVVGDVDFENVEPIVEAITPVPGGVGPMTIVSLFQNVLEARGKY